MPSDVGDSSPQDSRWRPAPGTAHGELAAQQDAAAGGRDRRRVQLPDGRVGQASIILRGRGGTITGHLRYSFNGKMKEQPLGSFDGLTREDNLRLAWDQARARGLTLG